MLKGQKPNRQAEYLRWTRLNPAFKTKYRGWKAGPNLGFKTHYVNGSRACRHAITDGKIPCNRCLDKMAVDFTGYLPWFSEDGQKMVCVYGADFEDSISEIPFGAAIEIRKGDHRNSPVVVRQNNWAPYPCPWIKRLRIQADIGPWCLQLWKDDELKAYFGMEESKIPIPQNDDDISPQLRETILSPSMPSMRELMEQREKQAAESHAKTNGHHKNGHAGKK